VAAYEIDGAALQRMFAQGCVSLYEHRQEVNDLNVFPVPDGDTGDNMLRTVAAAALRLKDLTGASVYQVADAFADATLMGARGNSGVILSQIFRGFALGAANRIVLKPRDLAVAFQRGVDVAYEAVKKPVEGTILTVARESGQAAVKRSNAAKDIDDLMSTVLDAAHKSLLNTPKLLSVLREAGVVDAGGQGLVYIYEGMALGAKQGWRVDGGKLLGVLKVVDPAVTSDDLASLEFADFGKTLEPVTADEQQIGQSQPAAVGEITDDILAQLKETMAVLEFPYDVEFFITTDGRTPDQAVSRELETMGDSLVVTSSGANIKVHIHVNDPGPVLSYAAQLGPLRDIVIKNMALQQLQAQKRMMSKVVALPQAGSGGGAAPAAAEQVVANSVGIDHLDPSKFANDKREISVVTVAAGDGIIEILESLGADRVINGGQTMNPSTEELLEAIREVSSERVLLVPNNSNILMAAEQACNLVEKDVRVIPSKSVPQGMSAMIALNENLSLDENVARMTEAMSVRTGEVTYAVRDTKFNGMEISEGDILGIADGRIEVKGQNHPQVLIDLLDILTSDDTAIVTVLCGEDVQADDKSRVEAAIIDRFPDVDVEVFDGQQPLYYYYISVE